MTSRDRVARLWTRLTNKEYRDAFVEEHVTSGVAVQIQENRVSREMSQAQLAERIGAKRGQGQISRLENPSGTPSLATLVKLASAFDCGLIVRFVPFSEMAEWSVGVSSEPAAVPPFDDDSPMATLGVVVAVYRDEGSTLGRFLDESASTYDTFRPAKLAAPTPSIRRTAPASTAEYGLSQEEDRIAEGV